MKTAVDTPPARACCLVSTAVVALALAALGIGCGAPAVVGQPQAQRMSIGARRCGACHELADPPDAKGLIEPELDGFSLRTFLATALPARPASAQRGSRR